MAGRRAAFARVRFTDKGVRGAPGAAGAVGAAAGRGRHQPKSRSATAAQPLRRRWQWQVPGGVHRAAPGV